MAILKLIIETGEYAVLLKPECRVRGGREKTVQGLRRRHGGNQ